MYISLRVTYVLSPVLIYPRKFDSLLSFERLIVVLFAVVIPSRFVLLLIRRVESRDRT
jgi:hypothetical protein